MTAVVALLLGILGGLGFAAFVKTSFVRRKFEQRKRRYLETGRGQNPESDFIGPHKSFLVNALIFGGVVLAISAGMLAAMGSR